MQDALLKTYQHVSRIADPDAFSTWLSARDPATLF